MNAFDPPISGTTRSPQQDLIDYLVWDNLSHFWTEAYKPDDRDALSCVYESMLTVLDAEYVRLFEINQAKSVATCPVFTQRRWCRLDMFKYNMVKAFLQFLRAGTAGLIGNVPGDVLACANVPLLHSKHWHIAFPWQIPDTAPALRSKLNLQFPIGSIALVDIYKIYEGGDGLQRGVRLMPKTTDTSIDWDFELLPDGCTINFKNAQPNEKYEILAGFNFADPAYAGLRPVVFKVENMLGANICQVPASMSNGLPVHAMVVRNAPQLGTAGLEVTNREDFDTERIFFPYTGDFTGVQQGSQGKVVLPESYIFQIGDVIFLFGTEAGDFNTIHSHRRDSVALDQSDLLDGVMQSYSPSVQIPLGMFGSIDFIGQQLQLFINGRMIHPSEYSFEYASNTFLFRRPIAGSATGQTFVDVLYMDELQSTGPFHVHQQCYRGGVVVPKQFAKFDDGGTFDDEKTNPPGIFDDYDYDNTVYINDLLLTVDELEVFVDGILREPNVDYVVTAENKRTRITFTIPISAKNILVTVVRSSMIYVYGLDDIVPSTSVYGITPDTLQNILSDLTNIVAQFEAVFGQKVSDLATLLEAAFIAAGGGNPLLALFLDEFKEYDGLPLDAPGAPLTAVEARTVESANTKLIDIPFLCDHVLNPSTRLVGDGAQFQVVNGNIQSSVDLTQLNGGILWCPLVVLDESMLSKNFGTLVNDVRPDSSLQYKNALQANLMLRFGGPTMKGVQNTAAVLLGSDIFTQDSVIKSIVPKVTAYHITVTSTDQKRQDVFIVDPTAKLPQLGASVFPGQSIAFPIITDVVLTALESWEPGLLRVNYDLGAIKPGDRARLTVYDPLDIRSRPIVVELGVHGVHTRPTVNGPQTFIQFDQAVKYIVTPKSRLRVFRDYGDPRAGFEGTVTSIQAVEDTIITTEFESFALKPGQLLEFKIGDRVYRGDPVRPGIAVAYDEVSKPNWHYLTPEIWRQRLEFSIQDKTFGFNNDAPVEKYGTVSPFTADNGYSIIELADTGFVPKRGTFVTLIQDGTSKEFNFRVAGRTATDIYVTPTVDQTLTGTFQFRNSPTTQKLDYQQEYFELAPAKPLLTTLPYTQRAGSAVLEAGDLSAFPLMGRVNIKLPAGGVVEFEYYNRTQTRFFNCNWTKPFTALGTGQVISTSVTLVLVAEYRRKLINPAFSALAARRGRIVDPNHKGRLVVTDANADEVYVLLKSSTAVLELRSVQEPAVLESILADCVPSGTSLEVIHRDVLIDTVDFSRITDLPDSNLITDDPRVKVEVE